MQQAASSDWTKHPVITHIGVGAAVLAFTLTVLLPMQNGYLQNQTNIAKETAEKVVVANAALTRRAQEAEEKLKQAEAQFVAKKAKEAQAKIRSLELGGLFALGNPYPVGLQIKIGDPSELVPKVYTGDQMYITSANFHMIRPNHTAIESITYYADYETKKVSRVLFYVIQREGWLQNKLVECLGPPTSSPKEGYFYWKTQHKLGVYKTDDTSFIIMAEAFQPRDWPKPQDAKAK